MNVQLLLQNLYRWIMGLCPIRGVFYGNFFSIALTLLRFRKISNTMSAKLTMKCYIKLANTKLYSFGTIYSKS